MTELLAQSGVKHNRIIGVDIDPEMTAFAQQNHKSVDSVEYWTQDMSLSWDELTPRVRELEGRVSLIVSNIALQGIKNKSQLMAVLCKLLATEGVIVAHIEPGILFELISTVSHKLDPGAYLQDVTLWRDVCLAEGLSVQTCDLFEMVVRLTKKQALETLFIRPGRLYPETTPAYRLRRNLRFDRMVRPNAEHPNPRAWDEMVADESLRELDFYKQFVRMYCQKK
ncbi:unnamed protein product [Oppiella nova]|uniref:Methyltransferase type 11 domain-containing protein n=1 Tax=Oppiella nova TaxID=334625 RepID=A0A7R9QYM9_9ACAR|nr:unnamed protein product [Oppiella nova]CAG2179234.1 unnamed protein product [Oppiella nova]